MDGKGYRSQRSRVNAEISRWEKESQADAKERARWRIIETVRARPAGTTGGKEKNFIALGWRKTNERAFINMLIKRVHTELFANWLQSEQIGPRWQRSDTRADKEADCVAANTTPAEIRKEKETEMMIHFYFLRVYSSRVTFSRSRCTVDERMIVPANRSFKLLWWK